MSPWRNSVRSAYLPSCAGEGTTVRREVRPSAWVHCERSPVSKSPRHTTEALAAVETQRSSSRPEIRRKADPFPLGGELARRRELRMRRRGGPGGRVPGGDERALRS